MEKVSFIGKRILSLIIIKSEKKLVLEEDISDVLEYQKVDRSEYPDNILSNCTIFVPEQSVESYKKDKEWGKYNIQPMDVSVYDEDDSNSEQDDYEDLEDDEGASYSHWDNDRDYDNYDYYDNYDWLAEAAGTDDPEVMNDVYWNLD